MASSPILGCIYLFAGNFAPRGFQLCAGQTLPISQNAALFSLLGTTYGGNGVSTFALPDLRGRAAVAQGTPPGLTPISLGERSGSQNATVLLSNLPIHTHSAVLTINCAADGRGADNPVGGVFDSGSASNVFAGAPDGSKMNAGMGTAVLAPVGGSVPVSIRNPYLGLNYIIAMTGIFPSRN
jgi:microcystin-dependent protein